jgi:hypothetical protein
MSTQQNNAAAAKAEIKVGAEEMKQGARDIADGVARGTNAAATVAANKAYEAKETAKENLAYAADKAGEKIEDAKDAARDAGKAVAAKAEDAKEKTEDAAFRAKTELKSAAADAKQTLNEVTDPTRVMEPMPHSPLSEITPAELLLQKANITLASDVRTMQDSSLPLATRAAAAADAVAQKATALYEQGVIAASSYMTPKTEAPTSMAPATASQ